jgi:hypothetical protein
VIAVVTIVKADADPLQPGLPPAAWRRAELG